MSFTPTIGEGRAVDALMHSVAASATWQAMVGATTEAAALAFVHDGYLDDRSLTEADFPRAVVNSQSFRSESLGIGDYKCDGDLVLTMQFISPGEYDRNDAYRWAKEQCALIKRDLFALGAQGGNYLNVTSIEPAEDPCIGDLDPKKNNIRIGKNLRLWGADYIVSFWGAGAA